MNLILWFLVVFACGLIAGGVASNDTGTPGPRGKGLGLLLLIAVCLVALGRWLAFVP